MVILPFFISTRFSGIKAISYGAFGNIITDTDPAFDIPFGFAGGLYDQNTKLVRFGCRDYDPDTGRWTAKDPILFAGGDTDLYGYCLSDPVNAVDPEGCFGVAGFGIGVFMGGYAGFVSGLQNHNILAGIIGGAFGAATGAIVGIVAPSLSASIGGTIGGAVGGMASTAISEKIANPCINQADYMKAILKGGMIGGVTGYMGSGMMSTLKGLGAPDAISRVAASLFTAPISMGLDLVGL
jgi:RHS repeat-associated protein